MSTPPTGRTITNRARVAAPAGAVFGLLADPVRKPEWNDQLLRVEPLGPAPLQAGSRFRARCAGPVGEMRISYDEVSAPLSWRTHGVSDRLEVRLSGAIAETADGCAVTLVTSLLPKGWLRLAGPAVAATMRRAWDRHLEVIRQRLEAAAPAS
ncbi:MAG: SRPBCC family protein [Propionicimonas sp.]